MGTGARPEGRGWGQGWGVYRLKDSQAKGGPFESLNPNIRRLVSRRYGS